MKKKPNITKEKECKSLIVIKRPPLSPEYFALLKEFAKSLRLLLRQNY
ncbi:MAG: hypothetical protein FWF46_05430 [Oscillospiraceae bacterium]|nr:hypothetical protein [Oscillospiraceae bacterium]